MDNGKENPVVRALYRAPSALTLNEFIARCEAFLAELIRMHPGFAGLHFVRAGDPKKPPAVAQDLSNLRGWLLEHSWDKDWASSHTSLDDQGHPTPASFGSFTLSLSNWEGFDGKFDVKVYVGPLTHGRCSGSCLIKFPRKNHPEFLGGPLPLQLVETVVKHWSIRHADFTTGGLLHKVNLAEPRESWIGTLDVGWLTYVNDPSVAEGLPSDVKVQRLDQGIVFKLAERMPDYNDPEQVALGLRVREALRAAGKLRIDPAKTA